MSHQVHITIGADQEFSLTVVRRAWRELQRARVPMAGDWRRRFYVMALHPEHFPALHALHDSYHFVPAPLYEDRMEMLPDELGSIHGFRVVPQGGVA